MVYIVHFGGYIMGEYIIRGGLRVAGQISPGGAKNAVLPILAASVLHNGKSVLHNSPCITDVELTLDILQHIGCKTSFDGTSITVNATSIAHTQVPTKQASQMRSSILFMGALLGRFGHAEIPLPGGCKLGTRGIGFHLDALRQMGAEITIDKDECLIRCNVPKGKLCGATIILPSPSVGATENIILAAVLAEGETVIRGAAQEPEITDLAAYLTRAGAKIQGAGTPTVIVEGVTALSDSEHTIIPDRIVTGTYLCAAAMTQGEVLVTDTSPDYIGAVLAKFNEAGCTVKTGADYAYLRAPKRLAAVRTLKTEVYPGFPTDMQAQFMAMQCVSAGSCDIHETIFEERDKHVFQLALMGANILHAPGTATSTVIGTTLLSGATVTAHDLRGGAALILAALAANGSSIIKNAHFIDRGYSRIDVALSSLGADVRKR